MITDEVQRVLEQIFGADATPDIGHRASAMAGSFEDVVAFAELLSRDAPEEELQQFLTVRPQMLMGALGYAQNLDLAFIYYQACDSRRR